MLWNYTTGDLVSSSPAVFDGIVYFGSYDGNVYALNAADGKPIWNFTTGGPINSSPAIAKGIVYIGSGDGKLYALNALSGNICGATRHGAKWYPPQPLQAA